MLGQFATVATAMFALLAASAVRARPDATNLLMQGVSRFQDGEKNWDYPALTNAAALLQRASAQEPDSFAAHYWQGAAQFHALLYQRGSGSKQRDRDEEAGTMRRALGALEKALDLRKDDPEVHALLSTLYGMQIADAPRTALWRGRKVSRHEKLARRLGADNPRVHYLLGMSLLHAPAMLGSKEGALAALLKAEGLFEAEQARAAPLLVPTWGHVHCLAFIGETCCALGRVGEAEAYYRKALALNPGHRVAKEGLQACLKRSARE